MIYSAFSWKRKGGGDMTQGQPITNESAQSEGEVLREQPLSSTLIDRILHRLSCIELPAKEHFERY
jgi:hypothetical protein